MLACLLACSNIKIMQEKLKKPTPFVNKLDENAIHVVTNAKKINAENKRRRDRLEFYILIRAYLHS